MPTTVQREPHNDLEHRNREALNRLIGDHVVRALGEPDDLLKVQVRPVGGDHYRVNVFVGKGATSARVAHSYFLAADGQGNILTSTPGITKQYEVAGRAS